MGENYIQKIKKYYIEIILGVFFLLYNLYFTLATFLKYENFYMGRFDLGNMTQTVWNTYHGNIFMLTNPNGTEEVSRLAFHADFILILLAPFYLFWDDPRTLLFIQTFILSIGGIFVYLISKEILKNKILSLVLALAFFISPAVNYTNLYDFHAVTLATTFFLGAFYFITQKKYYVTIIFLILAGITKEQIWAINAVFGLYLIFLCKQKISGLILTIFSILTFVILFWVLIPASLGSQHFAVEFYGEFGSSPFEIIKNIILNPLKTIQTLLLPDRIEYVKQLFMPLGYLSFLAFPFLIFAGPDLMINLLSGSPQMHQIYYQYSAGITPFIFISAIFGIKLLLKYIPNTSFKILTLIILIMSIYSAYSYGPLPYAKKAQTVMFENKRPEKNEINKYFKTINENEKISASNNLGSQLSHRRDIYVIPIGINLSSQVLLLINDSSTQKEKLFLTEIQNNNNFKLEKKINDFYVFKRISM